MKRTNISPIVFFTIAILLPALGGILLFLLPQRTYSENENRYLTTFSLPAVSSFADTTMQQNLTDGANDQFVGRDLWIKFSTALQRAVGFQDMGGVYIGKEGYYFERILNSHLSETRYLNNLRNLEQFSQTCNLPACFLPIPSKGSILKQFLPANAVLYDADKLYKQAAQQLQQASLLDICPLLSKESSNSQLYFKTDHHWTMEGAYLAYTEWCRVHEDPILPLAQFAPECVSENFLGTLYSKAPDFRTQPDRLFLPSNIPDAEITIDSKSAESIYDWNKLETKDKYGVYFGGNFGRIDIHTKNSSDSKTLLIIKDSFANSLAPFLMTDYTQIVMIDFRYYNQPLSALIQEIQPEEALILYEISNFAQDTNFFKILK